MERSAWPKNLSSSRKDAIKELLHAQNPTKKLRDLFDAHSQTGNDTGQPLFAEDLIVKVLGNTLSLSSSSESYVVLQVPTNACVRSEVSEGSESINNQVPRKTSDTWTRLDQNLMDDGHQWRTYDQKSILNSKLSRKTLDTRTRLDHNLIEDGDQWRKYGQQVIFKSDYPWNYFRCAHKIDSGCQATKQVRRIKGDPPFYWTIHNGRHTCKESRPQIPPIFNASLIAEQDDETKNLIFDDFLSVNQEQKLPSDDDLNPYGHSHDDNSNNNNQPALSVDYADLESAGEI